MRGNLGVRDVRWHHRASLWQPGSSNPDDVRIVQQRKPHAMSAGIGPASGSLDGEKDKQKMTESSSSEQPRVTQLIALGPRRCRTTLDPGL